MCSRISFCEFVGEVFSEESVVVYDFTTAVDEVDSESSAVDFSLVREGGADCTSEDPGS